MSAQPAAQHESTSPVVDQFTPHTRLMAGKKDRVQTFYDELGDGWERWQARSRYYYTAMQQLLRVLVPPGQRVLDIGCGNGDHLAAVRPSLGVGVDISGSMVDLARRKHAGFEFFHQSAEELSLPAYEVRDGAGGRSSSSTAPVTARARVVRAGMAAASGDVRMILDADMTVMPEDLPAFFAAITENKGEFINGSRMVYPLVDDAMRNANIIGNKLFAMLFTFLLEQRIKDTLCGTKVVMRHNYAKILAAREYFGGTDRWGDYDWIFGAAKHNVKIVELPIHYVERSAGVAKMTKRFKNALIMLRMCWIAFRKLKLA